MESRNHIKTRMLRNAAKAWGYGEGETENNFDPLVAAILSACAVEVEKISGEIEACGARSLESMIRHLTPDALTGALPAHGIACATPLEKGVELSTGLQLYASPKSAAASGSEVAKSNESYFSPTADFWLTRANIRFMATGKELYKMVGTTGKELIVTSTGKALPESTLWLGIDEPDMSLNDTGFYFDFLNEADSPLLYHHLPDAIWSVGDHRLDHRPGYGKGRSAAKTSSWKASWMSTACG